MKRLISSTALLLATGATAQTPEVDLLVPRLMLFSIASDQPNLRAIGNLPATVTTAPILIFADDGTITTSTMAVDKAAADQDAVSSPDSP